MDAIILLQECVVKVEEIKEEICDPFEKGECDELENSTDEVKAPVAVILQPKVEKEEETVEQVVKVKIEDFTSALPASEQNDSEEEELKPLAAVYLQMEKDVEEGAEMQEDPLAGPNACTERDTKYQITGAPWDNQSSMDDPGTGSSTHQHFQSANHCSIGDKSFQCTVCHRHFSGKDALVQHLQIHKGEKLFQCTICQKRLSTKYVLIGHMRSHTGEKPFQCPVCQKKFARSSNVRAHIESHTPVIPFQCAVCLKRFTKKENLDRHMYIYCGGNPFQCTICHKRFAVKFILDQHMHIHR